MENYKISISPMPKCCYDECPLYVNKGWGDLRDYCYLTHNSNFLYEEVKAGRLPDCPLVEQNEGGAE